MTKRSKYKNWRKILVICSVFIIIILLPVAVYLYLSRSIDSVANIVLDDFSSSNYIDTSNSSNYLLEDGKLKVRRISYNYGTGMDGECIVNENKDINGSSCVDGREYPDAVNFRVVKLVESGVDVVPVSESPLGLSVGDEILIINLQSDTEGELSKVGEYETAYITDIIDNYLYLDRVLTNTYNGVNQKIMVQRIPQYTDVTVHEGAVWYPSAWNGEKGGVFAFRARGDVLISGSIDASGKGFRGGEAGVLSSNGGGRGEGYVIIDGDSGYGGVNNSTSGRAGIYSGGGGAGKSGGGSSGSIGLGNDSIYASGGGGGGTVSRYDSIDWRSGYGAGGGGGGYGTPGLGGLGFNTGLDGSSGASGSGGLAGRTYVSGQWRNRGGGGGGGASGYGVSDLSKVFLGSGGGGGGAGQSYTGGAILGVSGGNGGGAIIIYSENLNVSGVIRSNGQVGQDGSSGGGGGSGGSVKVVGSNITIGEGNVTSVGGKGGVGSGGSYFNHSGGNGGDGMLRIEYVSSFSGNTNPSSSLAGMPAYENQSIIQSKDLIPVDFSARIKSFKYSLEELPENTTAKIEFSIDGEEWFGSADFDPNLGTGVDGSCTVAYDKSINTGTSCTRRYYPDAVNFRVIKLVESGVDVVPVSESPLGLSVGDEILIINLQSDAEGELSKVGEYETAYITDIIDNYLYLDRVLTNTYNGVNQKIMVQRIPQYTDVTVHEGAVWYPSAWNGEKGGVFAFRARGDVLISGSIDASGKGFRGGEAGVLSSIGGGRGEGYVIIDGDSGYGGVNNSTSGRAGIYSGGGGAGKSGGGSSGSVGSGNDSIYASGGGGGGTVSRYDDIDWRSGYGAGGGGGGYGTPGLGGLGFNTGLDGSSGASGSGGLAGRTYVSGQWRNRGGGGGGGASGYGVSDLSKVFLGSGGGGSGAGQAYTGSADPGVVGGNGGGIILLYSNTLTISEGSIISNGAGGETDGSTGGGGGSGGSVRVATRISTGMEDNVNISGGIGGGTSGSYFDHFGGNGGDGLFYAETLPPQEESGEVLLTSGIDNEIDLSDYSFESSSFYYRITMTTNSGVATPVLDSVSVDYDATPPAPSMGTPEALSTDTIRWYFQDNAEDEQGFILLDENENFVKYCLGENLTYCDESGLDENTSYTRKIQAYNEVGTSISSETATTYTLQSAPNAPILLERGNTTLQVALDEMNSPDAPYILYEESTNKYVDFESNHLVEDAVWGTYEEFGGSEGILIGDLEKGVKYSFLAKSKNGNGVETEYSEALDAVTKLDLPSEIQALEITDKKILWNIVDDNIYKIGYRIYDQTGTLLKTCLIDKMVNCLEENLLSSTTYQRKAKVFNNNTESDFSNTFLFTTSPSVSSISSISPVNSETLRINIVGNSRDSIEIFENVSGKYLDNSFGILSSVQKVFPYVSSIDVVGLSPNTKYEFKVRSNNTVGIVTDWSSPVSSYTFANKPGIAKIESVSSNSARIFVDSLTNPSTTEYLIRENNSGLFLDYQSNSLSQSQKWATISQLGNTNGIVVNGLEVGKQYSFSARARNFNMNNTDWSDPVYVGTSAIIKNVAPSLKVTLASSEDIDVTLPQNGQYGEKIVRLKMEEYLVADIPTLFDQDRDWGDAVVLSSVDERKTVVKLSESHGVVKPYTMYVYKDSTNAFLICPLAKTLEEVTLDCPEGIRFTGNFPQSVDYKEGKLSVSQAIIGGVEYWVADGITGTGGLGYIHEDKNDVGESPGKEVPDKEVSSSPRILDVLKNRIVDIASSLGIDKLEEKDLKRVSVAGNVVTATVSVTLLLGGLSQTWYGMIQLISIFLSSLGFRRKRLGYGFVYDSVTKNPVHMAMVRVFDSKGKLVETLVTDINGRFFGFLKNGKYNLTVSKSGYIFPSSIVKGLEDYPIQNIYQGNLVIGKDSGDIQLAIPIDSKEISGVSKHFSSLRNIFKRIILVFNVLIFLTGISISMYTYSVFPNIENLILLIMYIIPLVVILRSIFNNQDRYGKVVDQKGDSVEGVSVTLREMDFDKVVAVRVTDSKGRYRFILDKGKYSMSVDAEGYGDSDIKGGSLVNVNKNNYILCRKIVVKKY